MPPFIDCPSAQPIAVSEVIQAAGVAAELREVNRMDAVLLRTAFIRGMLLCAEVDPGTLWSPPELLQRLIDLEKVRL